MGIFGGLCISLFRFLLGEAEALRIYAYNAFLIPAVAKENFIPLCLWAAALVVTGFLLYRMCLYAPMAGGSGIPQVKGVILGLYKMKWFRILWVKIIAGALASALVFPWEGKGLPSRSALWRARGFPVSWAAPAWRNDT